MFNDGRDEVKISAPAVKSRLKMRVTSARRRCSCAPPCQHPQCKARDVQAQITRRSQLVSLMTVSTCVLGDQASSAVYDRYAATYDALDDGSPASLLGLPDLRRRLLSQASGRVLETAAGTGMAQMSAASTMGHWLFQMDSARSQVS